MNNSLPTSEFDPDTYPLNSKTVLQLTVGARPDGSSINLPGTVIVGRGRRPRIVLVSGVHGGEFEGVRTLIELAANLTFAETIGTIVIVPVVNPPAFNFGSRLSPIDSVNLNRVCPGSSSGSFTQRLAFQLFEYVFKDADLLVDLHSGGNTLVHAPLAGFYELPDSISPVSLRAAQAMGFPYIWRLPLRSGVLSCEAMRAGIPATGAELGGGSRCLRQHVEQYYGAVKNILRTWGMLADASQPYPEQRVVYGDWILAPASGYFESRVKLEHAVNEGEEIATIYGIENSVQARILAPCNGRVLGVRTYPSIYEGDSAIFVVSEGDRPSMPADVH